MLSVSDAVKAKFKSDLCRKELKITVGSTAITNEHIYKDGFRLTESVMDGTVEFVGCIASILEFKVSTDKLAKGNYAGQKATASVAVYLDDGTLSDYVPLFYGYVNECNKSADGHYQEFVCYDRMAYLSDMPGYNAYKAAFNGSTVTLDAFRASIISSAGMEQESVSLPNDALKFRKRKRNKDVTMMNLLRHICQINGAFGQVGRTGLFRYRYIDDGASPESVPYYRSLEYSDSVVEPIGNSTDKVGSLTIRTSSQDAGVGVDWSDYSMYAGTDPGWSDESQDTYLVDDDDEDVVFDSYIIEGNLIAYKLKKGKKLVIAANIFKKLGSDAAFREYTVKCNGLPYIECCDKVLFTKGDKEKIEFIVTKRVLEGIQDMTDTYSCTVNLNTNDSYVSNVDKSTNGLSSSPDDALELSEKTITENGTFSALDDGVEGFSSVTVQVSGGGGPSGSAVTATALENLAAGDTVYVYQTETEIQASAVSKPVTMGQYAAVWSDDDYLYYAPYSRSTATIYRISKSNTGGTPETVGTTPVSYGNIGVNGSVIIYGNNSMRNYKTGAEVSGRGSYSSMEQFGKTYFIDGSIHYILEIDTFEQKNAVVAGNHARNAEETINYSGTSYSVWPANKTYTLETRGYTNGAETFAIMDDRIFFMSYSANADGGYDILYANIGETECHKVEGISAAAQTYQRTFSWNAERTKLVINLGDNGLCLLNPDLSYVVYPNITDTASDYRRHSGVHGDYYWAASTGTLYYLPPPGMNMAKTTSKGATGQLGYVQQDVTGGQEGTAIILFS